jgi:hypothetical protein
MAAVTARQLNRATLNRQLLLERQPIGPSEAVRRMLAIQAQEAASVYIALWSRVAAFDPAALDAALASSELVKASLMRVTLHVVHAEDYAVLHEAMQVTLRAARLHDTRFKVAGLSVDEVEALVPEMLAFAATPRSNAEMEAWLDERHGRTLERPGVWWALRNYGPFAHAVTGGPWSFGPRPAYRAAPTYERGGEWAAATRTLIRRYLEAFGPATLADMCQFALMYKSWLRPVLDSMADELVRLEGPTREPLFDVPGATLPAEDVTAPPRLLPMWDSTLLAYADRSRMIPAEYRKLVARVNGDMLPALLVDGRVAGVWRAVDDGIEATAFHPLADDAWAGLEIEARMLLELLEARDRRVYSRYAHWWQKLPATEVRTLR